MKACPYPASLWGVFKALPGVLGAALLVSSCAPSGKEDLVSRTVPISIPAGLLEQAAAPRYAVVWTYGSQGITPERIHVTEDHAVTSRTVNVRFELPKDATRSSLMPIEALLIAFTGGENPRVLGVQSYRPRVIVYDDVNGNQQLDLDFEDHFSFSEPEPEDIVLAVDGNDGLGVSAIPELHEQFRALPAEAQALYYASANTDGRLSHFVLTRGTTSNQRVLPFTLSSITLVTAHPPYLRENVRCSRSVLELEAPQLIVDQQVAGDAETLCALYGGSCFPTDLESLDDDPESPPWVPEPDQDAGVPLESEPPVPDSTSNDAGSPFEVAPLNTLQCKQIGNLDALLLFAQTRCSSCMCTTYPTLMLASTQAPPTWWPCGKSLPYCESDLPLLSWDSSCSAE